MENLYDLLSAFSSRQEEILQRLDALDAKLSTGMQVTKRPKRKKRNDTVNNWVDQTVTPFIIR